MCTWSCTFTRARHDNKIGSQASQSEGKSHAYHQVHVSSCSGEFQFHQWTPWLFCGSVLKVCGWLPLQGRGLERTCFSFNLLVGTHGGDNLMTNWELASYLSWYLLLPSSPCVLHAGFAVCGIEQFSDTIAVLACLFICFHVYVSLFLCYMPGLYHCRGLLRHGLSLLAASEREEFPQSGKLQSGECIQLFMHVVATAEMNTFIAICVMCTQCWWVKSRKITNVQHTLRKILHSYNQPSYGALICKWQKLLQFWRISLAITD